jgi:hypothetical protein
VIVSAFLPKALLSALSSGNASITAVKNVIRS